MTDTIPTAFTFDAVTGRAEVALMSRETMLSRLMDQLPRMPWMVDLPDAMQRGLAFAILTEGARFPFVPHDLRRPFLFVVGDDLGPLAGGPERFHRKSLRKALGAACWCGIVPAEPERAFYGRALAAALEHRRPAVLVETQRHQLKPWLEVLARLAKVEVEVAGRAGGSA